MTDPEPIRVLIVDESDRAEDLARSLERDRSVVTAVVKTGEAALAALADGEVDCVVSEYRSVGTVDLLAAARRAAPGLPFVLYGREDGPPTEAVSAIATDHVRIVGDADEGGSPDGNDGEAGDADGTDDADGSDDGEATPAGGVGGSEALAGAVVDAVAAARDDDHEVRARTLLEASPVAVAVLVDGEFVYVNGAGVDLFGADDRGDLFGRRFADRVHPDDRDRVGDFADPDAVDDGVGTEVRIPGKGDDPRRVEAVARAVEWGGRPATMLVLPGTTDRARRERRVETLQEATREMMAATSIEAVCELAVETCREVLDRPYAGVWLYDESAEALRSVAQTDMARDLVEEVPTYVPGNSLSWRAFATGKVQVYEDVGGTDEAYNPETAMRGELIVPLGDWGVLNVASLESGGFDPEERRAARVLAGDVEAALDRVDREERLREASDRFRKSFEHGIEAALIADVEGDAIVGCNPAAAELLGYSRAELTSMAVSEVHPDDVDTLRDLADRVAEEDHARAEGVTCVRRDGTTVRVEVSAAHVELDGRGCTLYHMREVDEDRTGERRIEALDAATRRMTAAADPDAVADAAVDAAAVVADSFAAVYAHDPDGDRLVPVAATDAEGVGVVTEGTVEMAAFEAGESRLVEDYGSVDDPARPGTSFDALLAVPIGDHGQIHVRAPALDRSTRRAVETVGRTAETALDRLEREAGSGGPDPDSGDERGSEPSESPDPGSETTETSGSEAAGSSESETTESRESETPDSGS